MSSDAVNKYVLNAVFEFDPIKLTLLNKESNEYVRIHSTSAKCLLLLIEKHKVIVSQKELLQAGWGDKAHTVTYNTLYQCILNLRKSFIKLGCKKTIIITIPRKGLMIAEDIIIEWAEGDGANINPPSHLPSDENNTPSLESFSKRTHLALIIIFVSLIGAGIVFYILNTQSSYDFKKLYVKVTNNGSQCNYFINRIDGSAEDLMQKITQYEKLCNKNEWIFITKFNEMKSKSALICNGMPGENKETKCISLYQP